jgi:hypothetical protein
MNFRGRSRKPKEVGVEVDIILRGIEGSIVGIIPSLKGKKEVERS